MDQEKLKTIKKVIEEFFQKTTFDVTLEEILEKEGTIFVDLKTQDPQILIGEGGRTLAEIQHLLKAILKRKLALFSQEKKGLVPFYLNLDINNYKQKKYEYLKELARLTADEVALSKKEKQLSPMMAHERRIIHLELAERPDVLTESSGQEPERKVIVRPRMQNEPL